MLPDVGKERKKERKEERRPVGGKKWGCRGYFLNPGKSVHAEAERRVQRSSRKARINGSVFNHRDIQLTTFAPGGESSFQQKHKANRMRRLQSCSPCASNLERLKAYCTIVKFCANRWRKNRRASRCIPCAVKATRFARICKTFRDGSIRWISIVILSRTMDLWKDAYLRLILCILNARY